MRQVRYAIKVIDKHGHEMFLREGVRIGEGDVVRFPSRKKAEMFAENMALGLDDGERIVIVLYGALDINDEKLA